VKFDSKLQLREIRTRHGDKRLAVEVPGNILIDNEKIPIPSGSLLSVAEGETVAKDQVLAEVLPQQARSKEKATKDVAADLAGEVLFSEIMPETKTDRQGNTTTYASRGGLIWVLSGQVYNLPPGAEPVVKNNQKIHLGDVLAATKLTTKSGGVCRITEGSREIEIITASVSLDQADVYLETSGSQQHYVIHTPRGDRFALKVAPGTKVQNGHVVAELIDDRFHTNTGGIVKYAGIETGRGNRKQGYEVSKEGSLLWIPEESHEINKDISLLLVEDGQYVEAGTEIVKDIFSQSGIVEVVQKNDILREIIVKPGELYMDLDPDVMATIEDGNIVTPQTELIPGVTIEEERLAEFVDTPEGVGLLLRPLKQYDIVNNTQPPSQESLNSAGGKINLRPVMRIFYKDGERVKSVEGVQLVTTQLVLETVSGMSADIELVEDETTEDCHRLQIVVLESVMLRRELETEPNIITRVLVKDGDEIPPGAVVASTEIQGRETGTVRGIREGVEAIRRILVVRENDLFTVDIDQPATVEEGDLITASTEIAPGITISESGQVVKVSENSITLRHARPCRVSPGAILHIEEGDLVQRGDNLVLLVFERAKTGDIIQGLPRIEELLEARKPKEGAVLTHNPGVCQVEYQDEEAIDVKVIEDDGTISEYSLGKGQSVIVIDGQQVSVGEPLTDGRNNPHEILEVFFNYYQEQTSTYEAALLALEKVQLFLVNQVQAVYQSQGIDISDKHIEVIVRQMTSKVRVDDGGDTIRLPGELVQLREIEKDNETVSITGGAPVQYTPVLMGITKSSLNTDSFISAASFQETTRVLTEAAIEGKSDWLRGLKENVIIGRLIPAGTGFNAYESFEDINDDGSLATPVLNSNPNLLESNDVLWDASPQPRMSVVESEDVIIDDNTARALSEKKRGQLNKNERKDLGQINQSHDYFQEEYLDDQSFYDDSIE
jgi:DNA-directed RNA polymerase subunit beta'